MIADENVRRHYQQDVRDRLYAFFQGSQPGRGERGNFQGGGRGQGQSGRNSGGRPPGPVASSRGTISDRLARSGLVRGALDQPTLRESVLALTIVNHPQLLEGEYDEVAAIDYEHAGLQKLWSSLLTAVAEAGPTLSREILIQKLEAHGHGTLLRGLDQQIRNARLWIATEIAAAEDAREGYRQALALYKRARALKRQRMELEREIAEATETDDGARIEQVISALHEVQNEVTRMENQEAIIDGFGVMSGRVKGPATGHG